MPPPLLTIAVPTFNRAADLDNLLASIVREVKIAEPGQIEVLVSDNASDDQTPVVAEKYRAVCPAIKYIRNQTNIGMQANFAQCIDFCTGEYLYMIGDDEALVEGAAGIMLDAVRSNAASVYIFNYSSETHPDLPKYLRRVANRPIDTNVMMLRDFVFRHGWFWTLGNLGMVMVKSAPAKAADRTPHMAHTFMQAALYLEVFCNEHAIFIDQPVFHTFVRSQTVNKERWESDGSIVTWLKAIDSLQYLIGKGILPPQLPILFFNHCSCEWQPTWGMFLDRMLMQICRGNMAIGEEEWENVRRWVGKLDDGERRERILMAVEVMHTAYGAIRTGFENFGRLTNLFIMTMKGL